MPFLSPNLAPECKTRPKARRVGFWLRYAKPSLNRQQHDGPSVRRLPCSAPTCSIGQTSASPNNLDRQHRAYRHASATLSACTNSLDTYPEQ